MYIGTQSYCASLRWNLLSPTLAYNPIFYTIKTRYNPVNPCSHRIRNHYSTRVYIRVPLLGLCRFKIDFGCRQFPFPDRCIHAFHRNSGSYIPTQFHITSTGVVGEPLIAQLLNLEVEALLCIALENPLGIVVVL